MELARISISNFRNFLALDVELAGNVVVVGENRVGKSNLLYALRLLLDPTLPDSARQLAFSDFWDGLTVPPADNKITIAVEISDFEEDRGLHDEWEDELRAPHAWVYGDLRHAEGLREHGPFDLVFFLGVLYHSAFHLELLAMLNRVTRLGGEMLLETTTDPRPDSAVRVRWQRGTGKAKMVPTFDALRIELAWTGWREVTVFTDYRPESDEVLLLCRKTDELGDDADVAGVVRPQRGPAANA